MNIEKTITFSIETGYSDLRPSEQKAADYILSHLKDTRDLPLEQLANNCGVSQPTIVRMTKALGYASYKQFKYAVVEELAQSDQTDGLESMWGVPFSLEDKVSNVPAKIVAAASTTIEHSIKSISRNTYLQVIEVMRGARLIDIYGVGNSNSTCNDLASKLLHLGVNCRYQADPYLQQTSAGFLTAQDLAVGVSFSGTSKETVDAIKTAKKQGASTIVITNSNEAIISNYADYLFCTTQEPLFPGDTVFSRTSQSLIVDMLYVGLFLSEGGIS